MDRVTFQRVSNLRVREARVLLRAGCPSGAYYLIGYAVECALKACVSKQFKKHDLPEKRLVNDVYTHNLEQLVKISGLAPAFEDARRQNPELDLNWTVVKEWAESRRYKLGTTEAEAKDILLACTS